MDWIQNSEINAALFDIDGTLTTGGEVWGALLKSPDVQRGRMAWLYGTAMPHHLLSKVGLMSQVGFRERWIRLMVWLMSGWSEEQTQVLYERTVHEYLIPVLRPDVVEILNQHKAQGHFIVLVSTMFAGIVGGLAAHLGADAGLGSAVEVIDERCTGRIEGKPSAGARKGDVVYEYLAKHRPDISLSGCAAYADSKSDIPFLSRVGYPVATYPDEVMRAAAEERGWPIYMGSA